MKSLLRTLYAGWFALVFALTFLLFYIPFLIFLSNKKTYYYANILRRIWARIILFLSGMWISIEREESKNEQQTPCIYVSNHTSYLDILGHALVSKGNYLFMAKQELAKIPLFGIFFRTVDISVNRSSATESAKSYKMAENRLKEGYNIIIFPEGTIGDQVPGLRNFKTGAFKMAVENGVPIVPITFLSNFKRFSDNKGFGGSPGAMKIFVHKSIDTSNLKKEDVSELKSKVYTNIESKLIEKGVIERDG